jgi:hypothetical protein
MLTDEITTSHLYEPTFCDNYKLSSVLYGRVIAAQLFDAVQILAFPIDLSEKSFSNSHKIP